MGYEKKLNYRKDKAKKTAIISVAVLVAFVIIVGIIGRLNKEEKTENIIKSLA